MDIEERVKKIQSYFVTLSISDGAICIITRFPDTWWMGEPKLLKEQFKCELVIKDGCAFFMTELENGFDTVFDCIEYIVATNNAIFEKKALLETKVRELSELFVKEPLERLKTLYFAFDEKAKKRSKKQAVKDEATEETAVEVPAPVQEETVPEQQENNEPEEVSPLLKTAIQLTK